VLADDSGGSLLRGVLVSFVTALDLDAGGFWGVCGSFLSTFGVEGSLFLGVFGSFFLSLGKEAALFLGVLGTDGSLFFGVCGSLVFTLASGSLANDAFFTGLLVETEATIPRLGSNTSTRALLSASFILQAASMNSMLKAAPCSYCMCCSNLSFPTRSKKRMEPLQRMQQTELPTTPNIIT